MLKTLFNYCRATISAAPWLFALNMAVLLLLPFCVLAISYSTKLMVDALIPAVGTHQYSAAIVFAILLYAAAITFGGNPYYLLDFLTTKYTNKANEIFSTLFLKRSYETPQDKFYENGFYNNYEFVRGNIDKASGVTVAVFNRFVAAVLDFAVCATAVLALDFYAFAFIFVIAAVTTCINRRLVRKQLELSQRVVPDERKMEYYGNLLTGRQNARELRLFTLKDQIMQLFDGCLQRVAGARYRLDRTAILLRGAVRVFESASNPLLCVYYLYLVSSHKITAGDAVFMMSITNMLISWSMPEIVNSLTRDVNENYQYACRYDKFIGNLKKGEPAAVSECAISPFRLPCDDFQELTVEDVQYRYPQSAEYAVGGVNLSISRGEIVCILGYNGSGKTTLSKIICGLLEDYGGTVKINGTDIRSLPHEDVYRYFGSGFQEFTRYGLSVRDNIGVGMIEKMENSSEIVRAAQEGNLAQIVEKLPHGYDTILGKEYSADGQELSGGQWQRIILARAYMGAPEVLILDEPTASVDPLEEMRMLEHFREIVRGKTAILISHRIGFARLADRIVVMDGGKIAEDGTHADLLTAGGIYSKLFTSQRELYTDNGNERCETAALEVCNA